MELSFSLDDDFQSLNHSVNINLIVVDVAILVGSSINILANIIFFSFLIYSYFCARDKTKSNPTGIFIRFFILLQLSSMLINVSFLLNWFHGFSVVDTFSVVCYIQSCVLQLSNWFLFSYVLMIPTWIFTTVVFFPNLSKKWKLVIEVVIHFVIMIFVTTFTTLPIILDVIGESGYWCWIQPFEWQLLFFYAPLWIIIILVLIAYLFLFLRLSCKKREDGSENSMAYFWKLILYPAVFAMIWILPTLNRILGFFNLKLLPFVALHILCVQMYGAMNTIVYFLSPISGKKFRKYCCCCCKKRRQTLYLPPTLRTSLLSKNEEDIIDKLFSEGLQNDEGGDSSSSNSDDENQQENEKLQREREKMRILN